ncbi:MAG: DEAD/DEAH box helicase [Candidatus Levyibacteriota bacterium]
MPDKHMFHSNQRNHNPRYGNNSYAGRSKSTHPRRINKLDPALFIKKAEEVNTEMKPSVSSVLFSEYSIADKLKRNISEHGYTHPTPIQEQAIPEILNGRDLIGMAQTGSGKTAAFLITLINKSYTDRAQRTLIVVPTRELAIQIKDEFQIFAKGMDLEVVAAIGGTNIRRQAYGLRHKPHFVIGTPGRLKDLIQRRELEPNLFQNVVLDEVDRMVDIGFIHEIKFIVSLLPKTRQSLFFSATVDQKTRDILQGFVKDPVTVSVKKELTVNIEQGVVKVTNGKNKIDILHDLLITPGFDKVIVFGRTKWGMEKLSKVLVERGFKAVAIHGNKSQNQRQHALDQFRNNHAQILIATDVASRGLDIDDVTHVINYDQPETHEDYIHRIGRTGRAGKKGFALTFLD